MRMKQCVCVRDLVYFLDDSYLFNLFGCVVNGRIGNILLNFSSLVFCVSKVPHSRYLIHSEIFKHFANAENRKMLQSSDQSKRLRHSSPTNKPNRSVDRIFRRSAIFFPKKTYVENGKILLKIIFSKIYHVFFSVRRKKLVKTDRRRAKIERRRRSDQEEARKPAFGGN